MRCDVQSLQAQRGQLLQMKLLRRMVNSINQFAKRSGCFARKRQAQKRNARLTQELGGTANEGRFSDAIWTLENDELGFCFRVHRDMSPIYMSVPAAYVFRGRRA